MRYLKIICIFLVCIALSWCAKNTGNIQDAYKIYDAIGQTTFSSSVLQSLERDHFASSGIIRESFWLYSKSNTADLVTDIHMALINDSIQNNTQSSIQISWNIVDMTNKDTLSISGSAYYISSWDKQYINRATGYVWLWEWNAEWVLVDMILNNIAWQRMLLDDSWFLNVDSLSFSGRKSIGAAISQTKSLLYNSWLVDISYNTMDMTYPINIHSWYLSSYIAWIYRLLGVEYNQTPEIISAWYIHKDDTRLVIQNLEDVYQNWLLTWWIWLREWSLWLSTQSGDRLFAWQEKSQSAYINISQKVWWIESFALSVRIAPKWGDDAILAIGYDGILTIHMPILWDEKVLSLPIAGIYTIDIVDKTQFAEPTRYLLMSQVFGDEYGIANLLEEK